MHTRITGTCCITVFYPLPEDEEEYGEEQYEGEEFTDNDPLETVQDTEISAKEDKKR